MKSKFLNPERPTLTCMVQGTTSERIIELMEMGKRGGADAFGIQLERLERKYHTEDVISKLLDKADDKPVYITNYRDGVNEGLDERLLMEELIISAEKGAALVDIMGDFLSPAENQLTFNETAVKAQKMAAEEIHKLGREVLVSSHTYKFMTYDKVLSIAEAQKSRGADIAKIVTAANNDAELLANLEASAHLTKKYGNSFLFLCVGESCSRHRRLGPTISNGMFLCVAEHDGLATPAQPLLSDAKQIVDLIY